MQQRAVFLEHSQCEAFFSVAWCLCRVGVACFACCFMPCLAALTCLLASAVSFQLCRLKSCTASSETSPSEFVVRLTRVERLAPWVLSARTVDCAGLPHALPQLRNCVFERLPCLPQCCCLGFRCSWVLSGCPLTFSGGAPLKTPKQVSLLPPGELSTSKGLGFRV